MKIIWKYDYDDEINNDNDNYYEYADDEADNNVDDDGMVCNDND